MDSAEAYELVAFVGLTLERLASLEATHPFAQFGANESSWLNSMRQALDSVDSDWNQLRPQCRKLPELIALQQQSSEAAQRLVVASLEAFEASIATQLSARAPILEVLFAKLQLPKLFRQTPDSFAATISEFEKRLGGAYAVRMLADPSFAFAASALTSLNTAIAQWRANMTLEPLDASAAAHLRSQLEALGHRASKVLAQSRFVIEAALFDVPAVFEASGLGQKPKRKAKPQTLVETGEVAAEPAEVTVDHAPPPPEEAPAKGKRKRAQ